jgi:hypothetical protein
MYILLCYTNIRLPFNNFSNDRLALVETEGSTIESHRILVRSTFFPVEAILTSGGSNPGLGARGLEPFVDFCG